jgi:hypothetical protein
MVGVKSAKIRISHDLMLEMLRLDADTIIGSIEREASTSVFNVYIWHPQLPETKEAEHAPSMTIDQLEKAIKR